MYQVLVVSYLVVLAILAVYGFHRAHLLLLYWRHRHRAPKPLSQFKDLPAVTVQLPMFNEATVAERVIDAVARLEYPKDKLEIQILDDSTDETRQIAARKVEELRAQGFDAVYVHRTDRTGFKAGALEHGLKTAKGDFVLVFDADFVPSRNLIVGLIHFFTDPKIAMVQARWGHLNREYSLLTRVQSMMLDGHFVVEHIARNRSGRFFNFNGTAGIWRKAAIADAGGWQHDTLTEDMDLSFRAQLRGWRFVYVPEVVAPAEVPMDMNSFKSQQFRWAKGSVQTAKKMLPVVLGAKLPFKVKVEAFFHLTNNFAYLFLVMLAALQLPNLLWREHHGWAEFMLLDMPLFFGTSGAIALFYVTSHRSLYGDVASAVRRLPLTMALGIGLSLNNARAVVEGLVGYQTEFVRTPKDGAVQTRGPRTAKYRVAKSFVPMVELLFAFYFAVTMGLALFAHKWASVPFLALFFVGFVYVGSLSLAHSRVRA